MSFYKLLKILKLSAVLVGNLVLEVPEEALLRAVVPAVATLGHGLSHAHFPDSVLELVSQVKDPLVAVKQGILKSGDFRELC